MAISNSSLSYAKAINVEQQWYDLNHNWKK